jgi:hypothetical protein
MIPTTQTVMQPTDLLGQLTALIADVETIRADAEKWRLLLRLLAERGGYGPLISPASIANLVPSATYVAEIVAASQEVPVPAAAPKSGSKRTVITDDIREDVAHLAAQGLKLAEIHQRTGISESAISRILANGRA